MTDSYRRIGAVRTAMDVLEQLAQCNDLVTGKQLAEQMGLPYGTVMSHLATLCDGGYVIQVGEGYRIGARMSLFWVRTKAELEAKRSILDQALSILSCA